MRLILVRHGETLWNEQSRVQGLANIELNPLGRRQAEALALALKDQPVEAIYSSPLSRALETARAIARWHQIEVVPTAALQELDVGELDGLTFAEMRSQYSDFLEQWRRDLAGCKLPGGGCLQDLQETAWGFIQEIAASHAGRLVVAVSHNFAIQSIICRAIDLDLRHLRRLRMGVAARTTLDFEEQGARLVSFNDTCHLNGL